MAEELEFERLQQVSDEKQLNELLDSGWKLVDTVKVKGKETFILGWPAKVLEKGIEERKGEKEAPRARLGVVSFIIGLALIWFLGLTERGFLIQSFTDIETIVLMVAIVATVYGLSQLVGFLPGQEAGEQEG